MIEKIKKININTCSLTFTDGSSPLEVCCPPLSVRPSCFLHVLPAKLWTAPGFLNLWLPSGPRAFSLFLLTSALLSLWSLRTLTVVIWPTNPSRFSDSALPAVFKISAVFEIWAYLVLAWACKTFFPNQSSPVRLLTWKLLCCIAHLKVTYLLRFWLFFLFFSHVPDHKCTLESLHISVLDFHSIFDGFRCSPAPVLGDIFLCIVLSCYYW